MMHKNEFLKALKRALYKLEWNERNRYISYYSELIDDKIEDGKTEEEAVAEFGDVEAIAEEITKDAAEKGNLRSHRSPLMITLVILGSPLWLALLAVCFSVGLAICAVIFSVIIALFAMLLAFAVAGPAALINFFFFLAQDFRLALLMLGGGLICVSLTTMLLMPVVELAKRAVRWLGNGCRYIADKIRRGGK